MELFFSPKESGSGMLREEPECIWIVQENCIEVDFQWACFWKTYPFET